ncbi:MULTISPECIES: hypothetical protein [unclassified Streptomyces]|nr:MULTISPECIES: hypothetical protein [unclassified Streptomyces]
MDTSVELAAPATTAAACPIDLPATDGWDAVTSSVLNATWGGQP